MNDKVTFIPAAAGVVQTVVDSTHVNKMVPAMTGCAFWVFHAEVPVNGGPPLHYHDTEGEYMYVLSGEITFSSEEGSVIAGPGDSIWLPPGRSHGFRCSGTEPAKMLVVVSPGQKAHAFFTTMDAEKAAEPVKMVDIAARHGITFGVPAKAAA